MTEPTLDDTMPDNERLSWAIEAATGIESVKLTYHVLKKLPGEYIYSFAVITIMYFILIRTAAKHRRDRYFR